MRMRTFDVTMWEGVGGSEWWWIASSLCLCLLPNHINHITLLSINSSMHQFINQSINQSITLSPSYLQSFTVVVFCIEIV